MWFSLLAAPIIHAQRGCGDLNTPRSQRTPRIEITKIDLTSASPLCSLRLQVFGVYLGQTQEAAKAALLTEQFEVRMVAPTASAPEASTMDALYEQKEYLTISFENGKAIEINITDEMAPYLAGESRLLLVGNSLHPASLTRSRLLGKEDSNYYPTGMIGFVIYRYDKEGLDLTGVLANAIQFEYRMVTLRLRFPPRIRTGG